MVAAAIPLVCWERKTDPSISAVAATTVAGTAWEPI